MQSFGFLHVLHGLEILCCGLVCVALVCGVLNAKTALEGRLALAMLCRNLILMLCRNLILLRWQDLHRRDILDPSGNEPDEVSQRRGAKLIDGERAGS